MTITEIVASRAGRMAEVYLFGSRLDDRARGGDVDLFIKSNPPLSLIERARIKVRAETALGLPVDIVASGLDDGLTPFQQIAQAHAVRLRGLR